MMASATPATTSAPTIQGINVENRSSAGAASTASVRRARPRGTSAPSHKVMPAACTKTEGRVIHCGSAALAWPDRASAPLPAISAQSASALAARGVRSLSENSARSSAIAMTITVSPWLVVMPVTQVRRSKNRADVAPSASSPWKPAERAVALRPSSAAAMAMFAPARDCGVSHASAAAPPMPRTSPI
jgi:hypothetical protein